MKPIEVWANEKSTDPIWVAAAKALHGWPIGKELTEDEYDAAIEAAKNIPVR